MLGRYDEEATRALHAAAATPPFSEEATASGATLRRVPTPARPGPPRSLPCPALTRRLPPRPLRLPPPPRSYYAHALSGGTPCEPPPGEAPAGGGAAPRAPRRAEVRFVCPADPSAAPGSHHIESVAEEATCVYKIVVATPLLCAHAAFVPGEQPAATIRCVALPAEEKGAGQGEGVGARGGAGGGGWGGVTARDEL